jgi:hypothetical protein
LQKNHTRTDKVAIIGISKSIEEQDKSKSMDDEKSETDYIKIMNDKVSDL